jgi:hypothetical protein
MYTLSSKLKLTAIIFIVVGAIGMIYGFLAAPSSIEEVEKIIAEQEAHHGGDHGETAQMQDHANEGHHEAQAKHTEGHGGHEAAEGEHESSHAEHLLHQLQNKPWAATYVAAFFFFMIALGALAFYAIQYAAQAGWSPVLYRVIEAITAYLLPGSLIVLLLLVLSGFHFNHLFVWMDPEVVVPVQRGIMKDMVY